MDRATLTRHLPWLVLALAVAVELLAWALGNTNRTETFAFERVAAHAGPIGFAAVIGGGVLAALLVPVLGRADPGRRDRLGWALLAVAALAVHMLVLDVPQAQPDTVNYLIYARQFADEPLGTLARWPEIVWGGPQARFHKPFPGVPLLYGLTFAALGYGPFAASVVLAGLATALPLCVALLGRTVAGPRVGFAAGALALGVPFLQAQAAWILVDVPFTAALCLAWTALLRVRDLRTALLAALVCLLPLTIKISALIYLAGPVAAVLIEHALAEHRLRTRLAVLTALALAGIGALMLFDPPRWRPVQTWGAAAFAIALHLRPSLALLLPVALRDLASEAGARFVPLATATAFAVPVVVLYAPAEHAARYALPLAAILCVSAAAALPVRAVAGLAASGVILLGVGYRPLLVHNQAENVRQATLALERSGASSIEVWGDHFRTTFPPVAVAVLVDFYADVPVRYGGATRISPPGPKRRWWEVLETPEWLEPDGATPDAVLLSLYGSGPEIFEQSVAPSWPDGWSRLGTTSTYSGSSVLWPRSLVSYHRPVAHRRNLE